MSERIVDDLLAEILQWLPVKSLARCRCVCKSWNSLICSSSFINHHLSCSRAKPHIFASLNSIQRSYGEDYVVMDYGEEDITYIPEFVINTLDYSMVGTVNGVVCLWAPEFYCTDRDFYVSFALWNPVIYKYTEIPMSRVIVRDKFWFGFGFKASENDFRVLFVSRDDPDRDLGSGEDGSDHEDSSDEDYFDEDEDDLGFEGHYIVQICSACEKIWRDLPTEILRHCVVRYPESQCRVNGVLHMVAFNHGVKTLLLFNFEKEVFSFMALPGSLSDDVVVAEFKDKLAVLDYTRQYKTQLPSCKIWSMSEYGDPTSWVCLFDVALSSMSRSLIHKKESIVGITADGEIIIESENGAYMLHDPENCTRHWLGLNLEHRIYNFYACGFVESLFLMDGKSKARYLPS